MEQRVEPVVLRLERAVRHRDRFLATVTRIHGDYAPGLTLTECGSGLCFRILGLVFISGVGISDRGGISLAAVGHDASPTPGRLLVTGEVTSQVCSDLETRYGWSSERPDGERPR